MPVSRKKRRSPGRKGKSGNYTIWILVFALAIISLVFSDLGLIKYFRLKSQEKLIIAEIQRLESEIDSLQMEKNRLDDTSPEFDPEYIIRIAREHYGMVGEGEKVYRVKDTRKAYE